MSDNIFLKPILKWAGGKRQLLPVISPLLPKKYSTYVEPFIGGAAVLLHLQPKNAIINDYNDELINVYNVVKNKPEELLLELESHSKMNSEIGKEHFYSVRAWDRNPENFPVNYTDVQKAGRIIYLNKTCFNGLFRVNSQGQFNTPYGKYVNPNIINKPSIMALSRYFNENNISIKRGDYKKVLKNLPKNSFVYLDPPYLPISDSSSFTGYTDNGFTLQDQIELRDQCNLLNEQGIKFLLSNSNHPQIFDLYNNYDIKEVPAKRAINSKGNKRGQINEVLIRNYD